MKASQVIQYIDEQKRASKALADQLDEIQVAFNAQFDQFKGKHDAKLELLTEQVAGRLDAISCDLRAEIETRLAVEMQQIEERRQKLRDVYLIQRQQAADDLLSRAQAELAELRALNPQLNDHEEELKRQKAELLARLEALNEAIRLKSRGLGVVLRFMAIVKADRERQRIIGKLEAIHDSLLDVRRQWERESTRTREQQAEYQGQWQLESIAVARLQSELDQLEDETRRQDLALRRAIYHVLDELKAPAPAADPELNAGLEEMISLNILTDAYHEGLASVGGLIGLLRGIDSGMDAIRSSVESLAQEQRMHSAHLKPLDFSLPAQVSSFHQQWPVLTAQFADEKTIGANPSQFSAHVKPILAGPLGQPKIEAMFHAFGQMLKKATAAW